MVLNNFVSWKSLKYSNTIKSNKEYHYKTIHKNIFFGVIIMLSNNTINDITDNIIIDN